MKQQYTVFYNRKKIEFLHVSNKSADGSRCEQVDHINWEAFELFVSGNSKCLRSFSSNPASAFRLFSTFFVHHEAAGGMVQNKKGEYLFIFRNGRWDLPKGYVEFGEKLADAALREVNEECGLASLEILHSLPVTHHVYPLPGNQWALKSTHWFLMQTTGAESVILQVDEGITNAEWRNLDNITDLRAGMHGNIALLIDAVANSMAGQRHQG